MPIVVIVVVVCGDGGGGGGGGGRSGDRSMSDAFRKRASERTNKRALCEGANVPRDPPCSISGTRRIRGKCFRATFREGRAGHDQIVKENPADHSET